MNNDKPKTWNSILETAHTATQAYRNKLKEAHACATAPLKPGQYIPTPNMMMAGESNYIVDRNEYDVYLLWQAARELRGRDLSPKLLTDLNETIRMLSEIIVKNTQGE